MVEIMVTSFKKTSARTVVFSGPDPTSSHCQPMTQLENPGYSQASLAQSFVGSLLFSPGSCMHKVLSVPSKSLFPQSYGSFVIKSHWPLKSNFLRVLSPLAGSPA